MGSVDCLGMLYGNRRPLDNVLPTLPKHSWNSTVREQQFGRLVPKSGVDNFALLYGNGRRRESVLPPFSCQSKILDLLPSRTSTPPPSISEQPRLPLSSKLTAFVSKVKKALSGKPEPRKLPEKAPCVARPSPGLAIKPQELPSKGPLACMPSERLVVIRIIRSNHQQQHSSSEPLLLQGRLTSLASSAKVAVFSMFKEFESDAKQCENKRTSTLDEPLVQELEPTGTHNDSGEGNRIVLNEVNDGDTADDSKGDRQTYSTCSASKVDISTHGQNMGGDTTNDSEEEGKKCSDSSRLEALPKEESAASQIDNGHTATESEAHEKDRGDPSRFDAVSNEENAASYTDDGITANASEEDRRERSDLPKSAASPNKKHVDRRSQDGGTEDKNERKESDNGDCSTFDALVAKGNAVSQPSFGGGSANGIKGKEKDREDRLISDSLPSKGTPYEVEADNTAGKDDRDAKDSRDSPNIDASSETSVADESDGGVAVGVCQESWEDGSNPSTPDKLSDEDNTHEGYDDDAVDDTKIERKESTDSSVSDYFTADGSNPAENASDKVEVDAEEANRILDDDSRSLPSEDRDRDENEAVVVGGDDDTIDTSGDKENSSPRMLPSSSTGLQHGSNQSKQAPDQNANIENSHESSNPSSESSVDEGPWVMGVDHHGDIQTHRVSPVPFNAGQLRESGSTPLIESGESELDDTSPLFQKPSAPVKRLARPEHAPPSTSGEVGGLLDTKIPLKVWRDGSGNANPSRKPTLRRKPGMVFKDVSNTRQLLRNVQGPAVVQDPVKQTKDVDQTGNNAQRIPLLHNFVPYLQPSLQTFHTETRQHSDDSSELTWEPGRDPVRAAHFAASLAALERKVFPMPRTPKPLIRCARQEYEPDVLLDWLTPPLYHPKPIRPWLGEKTVENLEKQVASVNQMGAFTVTGPQIGPSKPTPVSVHYPRIGTFYSKQKVGNSKPQAASLTWTSFFARAKPQIERPMNPSPDAAKCHHTDTDG